MSYDFEELVPAWSSATDGSRFEVTADKVSGRIPVTRLEHWSEFASMLSDPFFDQPEGKLIFRGHRRFDWGMTPTLGRLRKDGIVTEGIAQQQLDLFRKAVRGRLADSNSIEDDELWAIGQHYGLNTPLLDWTYSPYVALFFAFAKADSEDEDDNPYRAVYVLNKAFVSDDALVPDIRVFEPGKDDHGRLVNQAGLFTFSPADATLENKIADVLTDEDFKVDGQRFADVAPELEAETLARYICKVYVKNEDQAACIRHMRRMNVHHASLFPDLQGASDYCNILMAEPEVLFPAVEDEEQSSEASEIHMLSLVGIDIKPSSDVLANNINELLTNCFSELDISSARIRDIADRLSSRLDRYKFTDWQKKQSVQAKLKNATRVLLRKNDIPEKVRNEVLDQIIDVMLREDNGEADD